MASKNLGPGQESRSSTPSDGPQVSDSSPDRADNQRMDSGAYGQASSTQQPH